MFNEDLFKELKTAAKQAVIELADRIMTASVDNMKDVGGDDYFRPRADDILLSIRQGRLRKSLIEPSGEGYQKMTESDSAFEIVRGTMTPFAARMEYGDRSAIPLTPKQRSYMYWRINQAKFEGDELVANIFGAVIKKGFLKLKPRPFLNPAIKEVSKDITSILASKIKEIYSNKTTAETWA